MIEEQGALRSTEGTLLPGGNRDDRAPMPVAAPGRLSIAYVNYGFQSGVTERVIHALQMRGHQIASLDVVGPLEHREKESRRLRMSAKVARNLGEAVLRFGRRAMQHRWTTTYAFDEHSREAGRLLAALPGQPDVILQAGALFAPGLPPPGRYVLLLDNTRALAMERPAEPSVGLPAPVDYGDDWYLRERSVYRGAWAIGAFSARVCQSLERDYGVRPGIAQVVGAGANVYPERVVRADDGETILFVGVDWTRKGGPVLARAFERIRRKRPRARLVVIGPRRRPPLPEGAIWHGYLPTERMEAHFSRATVFALPTLREPFGIAFLDAMASGLPCVGTAVEAVPEIIEHERTGLLVPPADESALAAALERLLDDRERARQMGEEGRRLVETKATWAHVAARLERMLLPPLPFSEGEMAQVAESRANVAVQAPLEAPQRNEVQALPERL